MPNETDFPLIHAAMAKVAYQIVEVGKDRKNDAQGFKFRGIDDIINVIHTLLANEGVTPYPRLLPDTLQVTRTDVERSNNRKGVDTHVVAGFETVFMARDGSSASCVTLGEGADSADKACNKAMSAAFKYALIQTFTIPTAGIFEDGDASNGAEEATGPSAQRAGATKAKAAPAKELTEQTGPVKAQAPAPVPADPTPIRPPAPAPADETDAEARTAELIAKFKGLHALQKTVMKGLCSKQSEQGAEFSDLARIAAGKLPAEVVANHLDLLASWIGTIPTVGVLEAKQQEDEGPFDGPEHG